MSKEQETLIGSGCCPFCGKNNQVKATNKELTGFNDWQAGKGCIQETMPYLPTDKREILISGICLNCQEDVF